MPIFKKNKSVQQGQPQVKVQFAANSGLDLGANRFELVVIDDAGNESAPAHLDIIVKDTDRPTAVLDMVDGNGKRITPTIGQGKSFFLSGARSSDKGDGKVVKYRITWVD